MTEFKLRLKGQRKGIKFNPDAKYKLNYGEALDPIKDIINEDELKEYFDDYVQWTMDRLECTRVEAEDMCRTNIGYWAGYHDVAVRWRMENVLKAEHPHLGSVKLELTPDEILQKGIELGMKLKKGDSNSA
jgi:hypothetical protein